MEPERHLSDKLKYAHDQLSRLSEQAERNADILRRSQQRELRLLNASDLTDLFHQLTDGLAASYELCSVSLVLADPDHSVRQLLIAGGSDPCNYSGLIFVESLAGLSPQYCALHKPWLGQWRASDHQLVMPRPADAKSIAMIPLMHKNTLFGSINFGSSSLSRFTREHATDFFAHLGVIASFSLENVINRQRLLRSGYTDVLTGWHNRRYLQVRLSEELSRARRDGVSLTCLMLDVDHFKRINDHYGHAAGDEVLRELAHRIESQVRTSDVAARYGGEEFVVLLPDSDVRSGRLLAERIRSAVSGTPIGLGASGEVSISTSIGIAATVPCRDDEDLKSLGESLLTRADLAMYQAKTAGRDRVAVDQT